MNKRDFTQAIGDHEIIRIDKETGEITIETARYLHNLIAKNCRDSKQFTQVIKTFLKYGSWETGFAFYNLKGFLQ